MRVNKKALELADALIDLLATNEKVGELAREEEGDGLPQRQADAQREYENAAAHFAWSIENLVEDVLRERAETYP